MTQKSFTTIAVLTIFDFTILAWLMIFLSNFYDRDYLVLDSKESPFAQEAMSQNISSGNFKYSFNRPGVLEEAEDMTKSSSPYWWLDSGGQLIIEDGVGKTIQMELPFLSKWQLAYFRQNPRDSDQGYHPQNIFRLLTKTRWENFNQQVYFQIARLNFSPSEYRNASNGVLLMSRYRDKDNLYYSGFRVDGAAVIKKKKDGIYYTLAYKSLFKSEADYDAETSPNFIPSKRWIGIRSETLNLDGESVLIRLYVDKNGDGNWTLCLEAVDDGKQFGGSALRREGYAGIRTDFMDVNFDNYENAAI